MAQGSAAHLKAARLRLQHAVADVLQHSSAFPYSSSQIRLHNTRMYVMVIMPCRPVARLSALVLSQLPASASSSRSARPDRQLSACRSSGDPVRGRARGDLQSQTS